MATITILHNPDDGDSRDFLASLGVPVPQGEDVTVDLGGAPVRVVSGHALAVAVCPAFARYPALVYRPGEAEYVLNAPESWQQCLDFLDAPWGDDPPPAFHEMTRLEFLARFTEAELVLLKGLEATDPNVGLFWEEWRAATSVRNDDPRTVRALDYLTAQGHLAPGRKEEILAF